MDVITLALLKNWIGDSRIVDHNLDVSNPPNGWYVRWENGLAINMVWGWVTGDGTSQVLSQSKTMPSSMLLVTAITASSAGFKTGSDPTSLQDSGTADREVVFAKVVSSLSINVRVRRLDGTIIPDGTRILWSAIIVGRWK